MQASIVTSPQLPQGYVYDCRPSFNTADIVNVLAGRVRDHANTADIVNPSTLPCSMIVSGAGGLDTGARAAQTNYAIYLILNPFTGQLNTLASLNFVTPTTLPAGFTVYRRIGAISLNAVSGIRSFFCFGLGTTREIWWNLGQGPIADNSLRCLNAGAATVATVITAANRFFFPTSPTIGLLGTFVTANVGTNSSLGPTGQAALNNQMAISASVAAVVSQDRGMVSNVGTGSPSTISYSVPNAADALNLWVQYCTDQLAA